MTSCPQMHQNPFRHPLSPLFENRPYGRFLLIVPVRRRQLCLTSPQMYRQIPMCKQASYIDQDFRLWTKVIQYIATPVGVQTQRLFTRKPQSIALAQPTEPGHQSCETPSASPPALSLGYGPGHSRLRSEWFSSNSLRVNPVESADARRLLGTRYCATPPSYNTATRANRTPVARRSRR